MGGSSWQYVTTLKCLMTIGTVLAEILFLTCHANMCLEGYKTLRVNNHLAMFGGN